jgi:hypothetical protein
MDCHSNQRFLAQQSAACAQSSYNRCNFTSSANLSPLASINTSSDQTDMSSRQSPTLVCAASVSSPSSQSQFSLPSAQNNHYQQMPQFSEQHHGSFCEEEKPRGPNNVSPFMKDFSLLAEAAKRAQMAIMMRDFDDLGM